MSADVSLPLLSSAAALGSSSPNDTRTDSSKDFQNSPFDKEVTTIFQEVVKLKRDADLDTYIRDIKRVYKKYKSEFPDQSHLSRRLSTLATNVLTEKRTANALETHMMQNVHGCKFGAESLIEAEECSFCSCVPASCVIF